MDERLATETIVDSRYRVIERIGSGGMADVYRAEDLQLGRDVALKVLYRRFSEDPEFVERFRREASSAAGLQHPNVVSVFDRGEWDGTYYIAMEHLGGQSLKRIVLDTHTAMAPERAIDITIQILKAAKFAHKRGVIHRDLKPHNVMVDDEDRVKVTDFGIALAGASDMTQTGSIMGTAQYLSPEQAQGQPVTGQSDLYAIGVILFELLTGRIPFDGESAVTIALKQVNETPPKPSAINPAVWPSLDAVVARALEKDPAGRFPDAEAFIAALEDAAVHKNGSATAAAPMAAAATAATSVAPAAAVAAYAGTPEAPTQITPRAGTVPPPSAPAYDGYSYPTTAPPSRDRDDDEDRNRGGLVIILGLLALAAVAGVLLLMSGGEKVTVAQVVGVDESSAVQRLRTDGFSTDVTRKSDPDAPKGTVIGQVPRGGEKADKGSTVTLTVSDGPGTASVPEIEGQGRIAATKALKEAGFLVNERQESSDSVGENRVISTSPPVGTPLDKGSTVTLVISTGAERVAVPPVVGQPRDEAETAIEDAGFRVSVKEVEDAVKDPGTVLTQTPGAGTTAKKGSRVTLTVAKAPETVEVPDVTGEDESKALSTLSAAGFQIDRQVREVDTPDDDGLVLEQSPDGGKLKKGAKVTIVVGRFNPDLNPEQGTTTTPTTPNGEQ